VLTRSQQAVPRLDLFESVDSTNLALERADRSQLDEFTAFVAQSQTAGQGRLGRAWVSEPGSSISLSLLLRPSAQEEKGWLTLMMATAVRATIAYFAPQSEPKIKWPNDVLVSEKKISGILAKAVGNDVILGVGINLKSQLGAPENATALEALGSAASFDDVLFELLTQFRARYGKFQSDGGWAITQTAEEFRQHSSTLGTTVMALLPSGEQIRGMAIDIDASGNLIIQSDSKHVISAADIIHLRN
jgi:BirA family biotin operon repressor/biotin-[acetyl-CoA-carboxylase] ligase